MQIKITTTVIFFQKNVRINQLKNNDSFYFRSIMTNLRKTNKQIKDKKINKKFGLLVIQSSKN